MIVDFVIPGKPVGKGRPRFTRGGHAYTPDKTAEYELRVKVEFIKQCGRAMLNGEIRVILAACYPVPASVSKSKRAQMLNGGRKPTSKPDLDNVIKAVLDALNGLAYRDDAAIVEISARKAYSDTPCVKVCLIDEQEEV